VEDDRSSVVEIAFDFLGFRTFSCEGDLFFLLPLRRLYLQYIVLGLSMYATRTIPFL
jgi:hypothetical protein